MSLVHLAFYEHHIASVRGLYIFLIQAGVNVRFGIPDKMRCVLVLLKLVKLSMFASRLVANDQECILRRSNSVSQVRKKKPSSTTLKLLE